MRRRRRRNLTALLTAVPLAIAGAAALAGEWDFSASLTGELRAFPHNAAFREQDDATISPSVSFEPEVVYEWNGGDPLAGIRDDDVVTLRLTKFF